MLGYLLGEIFICFRLLNEINRQFDSGVLVRSSRGRCNVHTCCQCYKYIGLLIALAFWTIELICKDCMSRN